MKVPIVVRVPRLGKNEARDGVTAARGQPGMPKALPGQPGGPGGMGGKPAEISKEAHTLFVKLNFHPEKNQSIVLCLFFP